MSHLSWLSALGRSSLIIYLAFFLPMAATRTLVIGLASRIDTGLLALAVTIAGVVGPLVLQRVLRLAGMKFLFERPSWACLCLNERSPAEAHINSVAAGQVYIKPESA